MRRSLICLLLLVAVVHVDAQRARARRIRARPAAASGAAGAFSDDTLTWPTSATTGYAYAPGYPGSLSAGGAIASNTTYSFKDYAGVSVGTSGTPVSNVTFIGCRFRKTDVGGANVLVFGTNIKFYFCTFEPADSGPPTTYLNSYQYGIEGDGGFATFITGLTVMYSDFRGFGNAINISGSTQANPYIIQHNYIHDASADGGAIYHTDGIANTTDTGADAYPVVDHNAIYSEVANTNGIGFQQGSYSHLTITRNKLSGWNQAISVWESGAGVHTFVDNVFSTLLGVIEGPFGHAGLWLQPSPVWRRNKWSVPGGASWGNPAHDGYYLLKMDESCAVRVGGQCSGTNDDKFVSATDTDASGTTYPSPCLQIRATPGTGSASVEFTAPTNNGGASVTGYRVSAFVSSTYRESYSTATATNTGASSPITVSGLSGGTSYVFTCAATNSGGYGYESAPSGAVTIQ